MAAEITGTHPVLIAAAALALGALVAGCSSESPVAVRSSEPSVPSTRATSTASSTPSASEPSPSASPTPSPTGLDRTATPATSSGPLTGRALPDPGAFGAGWVARVDPGSAEDGYTGNGTPVTARDPRDLTQALLPIGCADEAVYADPLPVPRHALEADYAHRASGAHGVALALDFGSDAEATRFVAVYTAALGRCTAGPGGSMVVTRAKAPDGAVASVQVDSAFGTTWRELVVRTGPVVRMVAVEGATTPARSWSAIAAALPPL